MVQTYPIAETITTLIDAEIKFGLNPAADPQFFSEWCEQFPPLDQAEQTRLDLIKQRYQYHRKYRQLAEGTVNAIVLSPLLELAGFFDPPFRFRSEVSVKLEVTHRDQVFRGRIDSLVVLERLWLLVMESKQSTFNLDIALPQALAYLGATPNSGQPTYGLVSNGAYFMFLKVAQQDTLQQDTLQQDTLQQDTLQQDTLQQDTLQYAFSDDFSLYRHHNDLWEVLKILKRMGQVILADTPQSPEK
jgi:hypothetical protein